MHFESAGLSGKTWYGTPPVVDKSACDLQEPALQSLLKGFDSSDQQVLTDAVVIDVAN